jgi:hypothetical protein
MRGAAGKLKTKDSITVIRKSCLFRYAGKNNADSGSRLDPHTPSTFAIRRGISSSRQG